MKVTNTQLLEVFVPYSAGPEAFDRVQVALAEKCPKVMKAVEMTESGWLLAMVVRSTRLETLDPREVVRTALDELSMVNEAGRTYSDEVAA